MFNAWIWLSELGNSKWLLPCTALFIVTSSISGDMPWRTGLRWSLTIGATASVVLASKIAFMGWGVGSASLDFTGFSGHAAMSACIYPPLAALFGGECKATRRALVAAAAMLAVAIAYSRLPLHAHSPSEVVTGLLLGGLAATTLIAHDLPRVSISPSWRWLAAAVALALGLQIALPTTSTHQVVTALAQALSGKEHVYSRHWLHNKFSIVKDLARK